MDLLFKFNFNFDHDFYKLLQSSNLISVKTPAAPLGSSKYFLLYFNMKLTIEN